MMEAGLLTLGESTKAKEFAMRCIYQVEEVPRQRIGIRDRSLRAECAVKTKCR